MSLEDIKSYLELGNSTEPQSLQRRLEILQNHLRSIERQANALEEAKSLLEGKVQRYLEVLEERHEKA